MRNKKKWGALILAVITVAALSLTGCRKEREKINIPETETNTLVSTESESESETVSEKETTSEKTTEKTTESETPSTASNGTQIDPNASNNNGTTGNNTTGGNTTGSTSTGNTPSSGGTTTGNTTGGNTSGDNTTGGNTSGGDSTGGNTTGGDTTTPSTEAPRYFYDANGNRVDVSQMPDGSWQDSNGTTYTFYENNVSDSNGVTYYYDPPSNGNTSVEVGTIADFYDTQGNHIVCTMDENGNWVDSEGNVYIFTDEGVTDSSGNFYPY